MAGAPAAPRSGAASISQNGSGGRDFSPAAMVANIGPILIALLSG